MLSVFVLLLHHPLACLAFASWHLFAGNEGGASVAHSVLQGLGFHDSDFKEINEAWTAKDNSFAAPVAPTELLASASQGFQIQQEHSLIASAATPQPLATTTVPSTPSQHDGDRDDDDDNNKGLCDGESDREHLGKWRRGIALLPLHIVCEAKALSQPSRCPQGWQSFQDSCYLTELDWPMQVDDAIDHCNKQQAHLVAINSKAENQFVQELVGRQTVWIGLSMDQTGEGNWSWAGGSPMTYSNWDADQHGHAPLSMPMDVAYMNFWKALCMPPPWESYLHNKTVMIVLVICCCVGIFLTFLCAISPCIFACLYKQKVTDRRQAIQGLAPTPTSQDFAFSLCGCFQDMNVFWHTCCCLTTRAADTHHAAGTESFWNVFMWWIISLVIGAVLGGGGLDRVIAGFIMAAVMTSKRRALKEKLGIQRGSSLEDFMLWWCCTPCVVAQEARAIDEAAGVTVKCCFNLWHTRSNSMPMVGPAVVSGPGSLAQPLQASPQINTVRLPSAPPQAQPSAPQPASRAHGTQYSPDYLAHLARNSQEEFYRDTLAAQRSPPVVAQVVHIQPPVTARHIRPESLYMQQ